MPARLRLILNLIIAAAVVAACLAIWALAFEVVVYVLGGPR